MFKHKKVLLVIFGYCLVMGAIVLMRHYQFKTQTWDMGIFDQTMWNSTHGRVMQNSIEEIPNHLGVHMSPFLFVLLPGYALFPSSYFLLIVQVLALGLGALPLYLIARRYLSEKISFVIICVYLLCPSLHAVNLFDFHPVAFLIPTLLAGFYFLEVKRWYWAAIFLVLAISTKEDAVLAVMFLGLFLLVRSLKFAEIKNILKKDWWSSERKVGFLIFSLSLLYFLISIKILMPMFGGGLLRIDRYSHLGSNFLEMIKNIFINPSVYIETIFTKEKIAYVGWIFAPLFFLPFFSWRTTILLVPGLLENLLTNYDSQFSGTYQYDSILIPGIFIALVINLAWLIKKIGERKQTWFIRIFLLAAIFAFLFHSPLSSNSLISDLAKVDSEEKTYQSMIKLVPESVSVAAYTRLVPHLSDRKQVFMLGFEEEMVDVLLVDAYKPFAFPDQESFQKYVDGYLNSGQYNTKIIGDHYFVFYHKDINLNLRGYE